MRLTFTTWNINSVRLRIDLVARFLESARPDVLCLQETKCPDDAFPLKRFRQLGYQHVALNGQKGYHGVAIVSRLPFETSEARSFCGKGDSRHISVALGADAGLTTPLVLHNFYVPAGGDVPDPALNPKFAHKLAFLDEMAACAPLHPQGRRSLWSAISTSPRTSTTSGRTGRCSRSSRTRRSNATSCGMQATGNWRDLARERIPLTEKPIQVELRPPIGPPPTVPRPARSHL